MTHEEMIAVIAAHRDGKMIEFSVKGVMATGEPREWRDHCPAISPSWNFSKYDYRIKPEPRVLWAAYYIDGGLFAVRLSESALLEFLGDDAAKTTIKKFVEVEE